MNNLLDATPPHAHLFSLLPLPVSLKPLAKGLLSIFNCVIWKKLNKSTNGHFICVGFFWLVSLSARGVFQFNTHRNQQKAPELHY